MNTCLKYLMLFLFSIMLYSCDDNKEEPANAEYYVKYEATITSSKVSNSIKYTVNTESGIKTFTSGKSFSQTFGPVKKGFTASISVDATSLYSVDNTNVKIYVSRRNEPFALKANNSGDKTVSTTYTIDY